MNDLQVSQGGVAAFFALLGWLLWGAAGNVPIMNGAAVIEVVFGVVERAYDIIKRGK